jgi:hypothetical protein
MEAGKTSNTHGIFYASWKCGENQIECAHLDNTILIESVCSPPNSKQELSVNLGYLAEDLKTVA